MNHTHAWRSLLLLSPLAIAGAGLLAPNGSHAQDGDGPRPAQSEAARLFAKSCASCHVYPDASLPTDGAWLGQIMETA